MATTAGQRRLGRADEDAPHTLLFVDILGFAALTATFRKRVLRIRRDKHGFSGSRTSPIQNQINVFHHVVDECVWKESLNAINNTPHVCIQHSLVTLPQRSLIQSISCEWRRRSSNSSIKH